MVHPTPGLGVIQTSIPISARLHRPLSLRQHASRDNEITKLPNPQTIAQSDPTVVHS
jgi:hypothetical protein